ncbi:MAG: Loki-CTERM sorting domain-containing protein [Promethearchaeota archaeon]|jgi:parallel beta-helix repeat protein
MKANLKTKTMILIILGIYFAFSHVITTNLNFKNSEFNDKIAMDKKNLKISAVLGPIHIDDNNPSANWSVAKDAGLCTGNGTYSEPYVIEDLVIDTNGSGSCIFIENSDVYFKIENCTVYNGNSGIRLSNLINSQLVNNNCSFNYSGISLDNSDNSTILGNIANNNSNIGISLANSDGSTISGNIANYNSWGMWILDSNNNTILGNTANYNSWGIWVLDSNNNTILGNIANNNTFHGMLLSNSHYTTVSDNTANNNRFGIYLFESDYNLISGNTLLGNEVCIEEINCEGNTFSDNGPCMYGQGDGIIPGYSLFFLLGILSLVAIILSRKLRKSCYKYKLFK